VADQHHQQTKFAPQRRQEGITGALGEIWNEVSCIGKETTVFANIRRIAALSALLLTSAAVLAQSNAVTLLSAGGYILVMRHAHAPTERPAGDQIESGNTAGERQLDAAGKEQALMIGREWKTRGIRIGVIHSSPTFRAVQTARLLGFTQVQMHDELGDGGISMAAQATGERGVTWLQARVSEAPPPGTNTLLITHAPNIAAALGDDFKDMTDSEVAVLRPDGKGGFTLLGRIKPAAWR
jgi:phosphohistidine phosphatase SixA